MRSVKKRVTEFFEGVFPVVVTGTSGNVLLRTQAEAQDDWMTQEFVPFEAVLTVPVLQRTSVLVVLQKDNPSGLPENDAQVILPLVLLPASCRWFDL